MQGNVSKLSEDLCFFAFLGEGCYFRDRPIFLAEMSGISVKFRLLNLI